MREISYSDALREALTEELRRDEQVFVMGEDIGPYGGAFGVTRDLLETFGPERVVDTPISEESFVGMAVGASLMGSRPVVEIMFMDFIPLAMDPLVNQAAKLRYVFGPQASCPVVIRAAAGGGRRYGPTHSQTYESWFMHTPGLYVVAPATPADAKGLLKSAIRDDNPVIFIEQKSLYSTRGHVPKSAGTTVPLGQARIAVEGEDLTIVGWGRGAVEAEAAAMQLDQEGIRAEVVDLRTLKPLDMETVADSVRKTGRVIVTDESPRDCSVSAEIGCRIFEEVFDYLDAPIKRVTTPDVPIPASPILEDAALPGRDDIVAAAMELAQ